MFGDDEPKQLAGGNAEDALLGVELDAVPSEIGKSLLQVGDEVVGLSGLDNDVVDVDFKVST